MLGLLCPAMAVAQTSPANSSIKEVLDAIETVSTRVTFRALEPVEIERYVATGEGRDKAGAYGVQGIGAMLVDRIEGDYANVVGLPIARVTMALRELELIDALPCVPVGSLASAG